MGNAWGWLVTVIAGSATGIYLGVQLADSVLN
jgi:hypothetical protein